MTRRPVQELSALCTRAQAAAHEKIDIPGLYQKAELRAREVYNDTAKEMEKQGRMLDAIRCYLLAGDHEAALKIALKLIRTLISQEHWDPFEAHVIIQMMGSAKLDTATTDKAKRAELLAYAALTGAYIAIWKGFYPIVPRMLATARKMVNQAAAGAPQAGTPSASLLAPITSNILSCSILYSIATRSTEPPVEDIPVELRTSAQTYAQYHASSPTPAATPFHAPAQPLNASLIIVAGSNLPARVRAACESIITKRPVLGPEVVLDDGSVLSLSEALMWAQVNPFSPTCTGKFLSPY